MNKVVELPQDPLPREIDPVDNDLYLTLLRRLNYEARLLDNERYKEWLGLMTDDVHYWAPIYPRRLKNEKAPKPGLKDAFIYNERKKHMEMRIARMNSGLIWCEDPRNEVRHLVSNVEVFTTEKSNELKVYSAVDVHRSRQESSTRRFTCGRTDVWRLAADEWKLAFRKIDFDHAGTMDSNLNLFF